ncbi:hypothetical protein PTH_2534 [Pelotomaculum thermopropionicum SI]|uniref:Uncharacterized protein n=1 Tax=Pelotomaculum thermopropionicum (strain DSM 13744 / JCM 10971 / SI) TaxID=370438 RepID=A5CZ76_PELTS|nr:hypothetical protein PTH_2534 [Pelotomaculum thermopropionicum SI]
MKLYSINVVPANHRGKAHPVFGRSQNHPFIRRNRRVGMNKVEGGAVRYSLQERVGFFNLDPVPAHVRHFQPARQAAHKAGQDSQAPGVAPFFAGIEKKLMPQANAQERFSGFNCPVDGLVHGRIMQAGHRIGKGPHPRQHHAAGLIHLVRIPHHNGPDSRLFKPLLNASEIPHPVVYNSNHFFIYPPFL